MENKVKSIIKKLNRLGFSVLLKGNGHKDPVCGMSVKSEDIKSEYNGTQYYFCSEHCKEQFDAKPTNFVD